MRFDRHGNVRLGLLTGPVFGAWDLVETWRRPLEDDTPAALLRFYGPMFLVWVYVSWRAAQRTGRMTSGGLAGMAVAFGTFGVFVALNFMRVNLFLDDLTGRPDWQNMMVRFQASGLNSLRLFVNLDYLRGTPFKVGFFTALGGAVGLVTAIVWRLASRMTKRILQPPG